jgi:hypothetical protein
MPRAVLLTDSVAEVSESCPPVAVKELPSFACLAEAPPVPLPPVVPEIPV